jgi:transglutaminase-like putative cysteine protease
MKIRLEHVTRFDYSADVLEGVMEVRLGPVSDARQRWDTFSLGVSPTGSVRQYNDGFGNRTHLVTVGRPHRSLAVVTRGELSTSTDNPFLPPGAPPRPLLPGDLVDYVSPSPLVPSLAEFDELAHADPALERDTGFERVQELMHLVHAQFAYQRNVTTVATKVDEVMRLRSGVCQDFAHVLLGLCRAAGVPARYVSGYTVAAMPDADAVPRPQASHAWVEAFTPTHGWRGFDATNDVVVGEGHVKVAVGRDYADVSPTRGSFRGNAAQQLTVTVDVSRID